MRFGKLLVLFFVPTLCFAAQVDRISGPIDSSQKVVLPGNVHPMAKPEYDQGPVEPSFALSSVTLVMAPSPSQQAALEQLLAQQQDRTSPNYHKWLTPEQYADRFGVSQNDINKINVWLETQGMTVLRVARGRNAIIFSATAGQIQSAFNTEIHRYNINGEDHIANAFPISVPYALSGVITEVRGLTNFRMKPMYVRAARGSASIHPHYTTTISGNTDYFLAPGDIATLYDLTPLYTATPTPINGTGQKLAIVGQTDVYLADLNDFRSGFGLSTIPTTGAGACATNSSGVVITPCDTTYFSYILAGSDFGVSSSDVIEADLDLEWSGAIASNAQIVFVNAPINSDQTAGGVDVSLQYAIDNAVAPVISMSYGLCEQANESLETELQQANTEGITVMNSAGDIGSFACDYTPPGTTATSEPNPPFEGAQFGLGVSYPASSPEVTGVGGTSIPSQDYSSIFGTTNGTNGGSATAPLSGQEVSWNDDSAIASLCQGEPANSFCENGGPPAVTGWVALGSSATAQQVQEDIWLSAGGGGVSNCFSETAEGVCTAGFAKPSWQTVTIPGLGTPQSGYRFVPDVSLLASPNFPGYIICTPMNALTGSGTTASSCASGIATAVDTNFSLVGGTSAASPVFAGIITLMNQYLGSAGLGNINSTLYTLAKTSSNGAFHPVNVGDNDVYCQAGTPAGQPADVICPHTGVAGFSAATFDSTTKYNLVTGLGSVDANNLATAWKNYRSASAATVTISTTAPASVFQGASVAFTASVTPTTYTGAVGFSNNGSPTYLATSLLNVTGSGIATFTTTTLPPGTDSVTATYLGDASVSGGEMSATPATVNVLVPFTLALSNSSPSVSAGSPATVNITVTPVPPFSGSVQFSCSGGLPSGATCSFPNSGMVTLSGTTAQTIALTITTLPNMATASAVPVTITGTSSSPAASESTTLALTVTKTNESLTLSSTAKTFTVGVGGTASVQVTVKGTNGFVNSSNSTTVVPLTYTCSGIPASAEISCQPQGNGQPTNATTVTVALVTTPVTSRLDRPFSDSGIFYAALLPGFFGIFFIRPRMRGLRMLSLIVVIGFSTLWLGSCGGKSSNTGPSSLTTGGTPPGNYSVTINATTGGAVPLTGSVTITLSVSSN
jgi:subtilase family serine protease